MKKMLYQFIFNSFCAYYSIFFPNCSHLNLIFWYFILNFGRARPLFGTHSTFYLPPLSPATETVIQKSITSWLNLQPRRNVISLFTHPNVHAHKRIKSCYEIGNYNVPRLSLSLSRSRSPLWRSRSLSWRSLSLCLSLSLSRSLSLSFDRSLFLSSRSRSFPFSRVLSRSLDRSLLRLRRLDIRRGFSLKSVHVLEVTFRSLLIRFSKNQYDQPFVSPSSPFHLHCLKHWEHQDLHQEDFGRVQARPLLQVLAAS